MAKKEKPAKKGNQEKPEEKRPSLTLEATQMWSPVMDIKDGIILTKDGQYVQILEIAPINFLLYQQDEQEAIADAFGAAISIFPDKFQIKILSRQANADKHIQDLLNAKKAESNPFCQQMQDHAIMKIKANAARSTQRRFFIAHTYKSDGGLRSASWEEIRSKMRFASASIVRSLSANPCANTLVSPIGDFDAQLDALYQCMCRAETEIKPLEDKVVDVVSRYIAQGKLTDETQSIPINEFIAPQRIDPRSPKYIVVDGKYYAFGFIEGGSYPLKCLPGWVTRLVNLGTGVDVDIFVSKRDTRTVMNTLPYSIDLDKSALNHRTSSSGDVPYLQNKLESEQYIQDSLSNRQTLCDFSIIITAVADSANELHWKVKSIQKSISECGLQYHSYTFQHLDAFRATLPLCNPNKSLLRRAKRNIISCDFGAAYPFVSYEVNDNGGIMLGVNMNNGSPVYINPFDRKVYTNGHMIMFGTTRTGKTYCIQTMALGFREIGTQVIIITPHKGHEYRRACNAVGGEFISLAPGSPQNINIMEIRKVDTSVNAYLDGEESTQSSILAEKIQKIHAFISLLKPDMTPLNRQALDEALIITYKRFGITINNKSLIDPKNPSQYKPMPILGDLDKALAEVKGGSEIREVLSRFVFGSARSFNGPTNVNLDNSYVVLDITSMPKELVPIGMFIANDFVFDSVRADRTKQKVIFNDELSRLIGIAGSGAAAETILTNYKVIGAYNAIYVSATQDANDFFALNGGVYGRGILANAKIKILLRQEKEEAETLGRMMGLSDGEVTELQYFDKGEALLIANRNHIEIKVIASELEDDLINTDPNHLKLRLQKKNSSERRS